MNRTAISLSGGGHRACLFALGALLYLSDAEKNRQVTSIASVSGGSLANGAIAQALDYRTATKEEAEAAIAATARQVSGKGTLFAWPLTWIYLAALVLLAVLVGVGPWCLPLGIGLKVAVFLAGLLLFGFVASLRGRVCAAAYAKALFSPEGSPTPLREINPSLDHVICATDLHAGENVYFSARFVCAYRFGLGEPGGRGLPPPGEAAAAGPPVFPVAWLPTARHRFKAPGQSEAAQTKKMALTDGGVYDNMADQWARGLARRSRRWAALSPEFGEADELVVINASGPLSWGSLRGLRLPLLGELAALLRDKSVLYDNGNSLRREELVACFDLAEREGRGFRGTLVHIPQSPYDIPDAFRAAGARWPERASRAQAAIAHLGDLEDVRSEWTGVAAANAAVATTLGRLGAEVSARLLHHAYVLAMVNTHVVLGYPLLAVPARERFRKLVSEPASR